MKTGKHISNLKKQEASDNSNKAFSEELTNYYSQHVDEKGASISPATHLARFHAVQGAMFAGISMAKLDSMRALLERNGEA